MKNLLIHSLLAFHFLQTGLLEGLISDEELNANIQLLGSNHNYIIFDLQLTESDLNCLEQIKVTNNKEYSRFGDLPLLEKELPEYLKSIGNDDPEINRNTTILICKIAKQVVSASKKDSAWVTLRATIPSDKFKTPRWHSDGPFYPPKNSDSYYDPYYEPYGHQYKFVWTPKGPSTLFYDLPDTQREEFDRLSFHYDRDALHRFIDIHKAVSFEKDFGAFFIVGNMKYGAVHSEPDLVSDRLFISILPGNKEEIQHLYDKWH